MSTKGSICRVTVLAAVMALPTSGAFAQEAVPQASAVERSVDNTKTNVRDRSDETMKPTDQPNNQADIKLAAAVRRAIVHDKELSTMAHNVKLVAANGVVTLRGPVKNSHEKARVEQLAAKVAGVTSVENELDTKQ